MRELVTNKKDKDSVVNGTVCDKGAICNAVMYRKSAAKFITAFATTIAKKDRLEAQDDLSIIKTKASWIGICANKVTVFCKTGFLIF
mmetsp:Transcript_6926/g.10561  ORF Transcript_6926/g.10561 Transcript_6926/m.10561 type:complete len:87 (+) Transcript_6926:938-1198(+)